MHRRSQKEGGEQGGRPLKSKAISDKNMTKKPIVSLASVFFSIFHVQQYTRTTVIINNIDNLGADATSIQFLRTNLHV